MTWLRKMRPMLIVVGLALALGSLFGSRALNGGSDAAASDSKAAETAHQSAGGPVVLGYVDTVPPPVSYGLPPVLQSGTVSEKVKIVKDGDEVKSGQVLYAFDDTIQKADLGRAKAAVAFSKTKVAEANAGVTQYDENIKFAKLAVDMAQTKVDLNAKLYHLVETNLETFYKAEKTPPAEWADKKKGDASLYKARVDYDTATGELNLAKQKLSQLKTVDPQIKVKEAEAAVKQAEAEEVKAQAAVDLCVIRARTAGTIEQVSVSPGATIGVATRTPALWLIPAGPRVVRAEVEGEFAHRVGTDRLDKSVTIFDHTDPKLTYSGVIRRIGTSFLPKTSSTDSLFGNDTRVIPVLVEVTDPAPAGKPPLRVGQRVRVNLGQ